ncbi:VapE domain-containing protein [Escherichia coli]|uniref:VapE domain-containing protein n=1 Tax=Enterobacteriaceae TaxID=543 RepID=UPI00358DD7E0
MGRKATRGETFSLCFKCEVDEEYIATVSRYTWMALAGHVMQSGIKADMVPLLYGAQGARWSTGVHLISPVREPYGCFNLNDKNVPPMVVRWIPVCLRMMPWWHHDHLLTVQLSLYRHSY